MERFHFIPKEKLKELPKGPGVYAFSAGKKVLYIGKGADIRERAKNHFQQPTYRDNLFIPQVTRVGYLETQSEIDALLLESQLIKKLQPKYNVTWKDDKKYFYVAITKERLPRVFLTHQPGLPRPGLGAPRPGLGNTYIGPFVEGRDIKQVLRLLRKAFPYYPAKRHPVLPCPYCHIGLCPGPNPDAKTYKQNIKNLAAVLKGGRVSVLNNLKRSMEQASKQQDFERAAVLRDQVFSLENVASHAMRWRPLQETPLPKPWSGYRRIEAYDISNIQGKQSTGSMVTFLKGKPAKEWYRKFKIRLIYKKNRGIVKRSAATPRYNARRSQAVGSDPNDFAMMQELISRRLKHTDWPYPDLMLIDGGKGQLSSALKALRDTKGIRVVALAKRNNELFSPGKAEPVLLRNLRREVSNLLLHVRDEAHRFAIAYHRRLRKKSVFE